MDQQYMGVCKCGWEYRRGNSEEEAARFAEDERKTFFNHAQEIGEDIPALKAKHPYKVIPL